MYKIYILSWTNTTYNTAKSSNDFIFLILIGVLILVRNDDNNCTFSFTNDSLIGFIIFSVLNVLSSIKAFRYTTYILSVFY